MKNQEHLAISKLLTDSLASVTLCMKRDGVRSLLDCGPEDHKRLLNIARKLTSYWYAHHKPHFKDLTEEDLVITYSIDLEYDNLRMHTTERMDEFMRGELTT